MRRIIHRLSRSAMFAPINLGRTRWNQYPHAMMSLFGVLSFGLFFLALTAVAIFNQTGYPRAERACVWVAGAFLVATLLSGRVRVKRGRWR